MRTQVALSRMLCLLTMMLVAACEFLPQRTGVSVTKAPASTAVESTPTTGVGNFDYRSSATVNEIGSQPPAEVVRFLVGRWLSHFKTAGADIAYRVDDYKVEGVDLSHNWAEFISDTSPEDLVAAVNVSIKPSRVDFTPWAWGSGDLTKDGWISHKDIIVVVTGSESTYQLRRAK